MFNRPELYIAFYALQKLGAVVAWINSGYRSHEVTFILENSQAVAVLAEKREEGFDNLGLIRELRHNLPHLAHVVSVGGGEGYDVVSFEELIDRGKEREIQEAAASTCTATSPCSSIHRGQPGCRKAR